MLLTACLVGKSVQWGFLQEAKPSLPLFPLLRPPENLKERWNMMLFSWDGSGTETIHCFRTAEPTHHYTRKCISLYSGSLFPPLHPSLISIPGNGWDKIPFKKLLLPWHWVRCREIVETAILVFGQKLKICCRCKSSRCVVDTKGRFLWALENCHKAEAVHNWFMWGSWSQRSFYTNVQNLAKLNVTRELVGVKNWTGTKPALIVFCFQIN